MSGVGGVCVVGGGWQEWRGRSDADKEHQRKEGGRRGEKRGDTEIRVMLENGRKYKLGAGLRGRHDEKTTGLS